MPLLDWYNIPETFDDPADIGEYWWDVSNPASGPGSNIQDISPWIENQLTGSADIFGAMMNPFLYEAGDPENTINPYTFALQNYEFFQPYDVDRGELYRAQESGEIGRDLLQSEHRYTRAPALDRRVGSTGFASSGVRPRRSLYDQFASDYDEIQQETEVSINDVFSSFGSSIISTMGSAGEQGAFDPGGAMYEDIQDEFDFISAGGSLPWVGPGEDPYVASENMTFNQQVEGCFNWYFANMVDPHEEGGQYGPAQFMNAAQWCAQNYGV